MPLHRLEMELWTRDAQKDIRFGGVVEGRGRAIIVTAVAPGSEAEQVTLDSNPLIPCGRLESHVVTGMCD